MPTKRTEPKVMRTATGVREDGQQLQGRHR
jgi:hypothetical protein